ncbi:DUF4294 domain-containing protein [Mucilaginibacter gotjawali]|uniref:Uncharacterized protein n=2 Tax=Mucilaginibacter gotjawali TaxID=1550579 RepID=A0A110B254_9SPHI|nr:DUF4294 domain-containing protein [Mucilaginibacter gotjawali]MBB3055565.1 hypothetical protein [Mucilaginibacter gotjawali]BAU53155.1 hypothetical protein MgSA37_01322 [Mucilaginibacter gotjawali]
MKFIGLLLLFCCALGTLRAQPAKPGDKPAPLILGKNDTIKTYLTVDSGKLLPWIVLEDVKIVDTRIFRSQADLDNFRRLRYNVMKVLPYARFAGQRYRKLQRDLAVTANKGDQKKLIDGCEKEIKDLFNKQIKDLTISQGEILIKLIDRETGNTSYAMVKDMKGGFKAFVYQSVARLFGHDLKETYNPDEQRDIEAILLQAGYSSSND